MELSLATYLVPTLVMAALCVGFWQGMQGTDDLRYAQVAFSHLPGPHAAPLYLHPTHQDGRLGAIFALAVSFFLFGVSTFALIVTPLVSTILTVPLVVWLAGRFWGERVALAAGVLFAALPQTVGLGTFFMPEPLVTFDLCLAAVLFLMALQVGGQRSRALLLAAGGAIGLAYMTTEVGALALPTFYLYVILDRRLTPEHAWLLGGFLAVLSLELAYHAMANGNPLYRFTRGGAYAQDPMVKAANEDLGYRLVKAYPSQFVYPNLSFGLMGPLMAAGGIYAVARWRESSFFLIWSGIILLFYNFMSASFTTYVALPAATRLLAPALIPLLVVSARLLVDLWARTAKIGVRTARGGARALFAAVGLCCGGASLFAMYLNTAPTFATALAGNAKIVARAMSREPSVTVITDPTSARAIQFYRRFNPKDTFIDFAAAETLGDARAASLPKPVFVVLDGVVLNERAITGHTYGGTLTLSSADSVALSRLTLSSDGAFLRGRFPSRGPLGDMLEVPGAHLLMGDYSYRLAKQLLAPDSSLTQVRVFRYDAVQWRGGGPAATVDGGEVGADSGGPVGVVSLFPAVEGGSRARGGNARDRSRGPGAMP